MSKVYDMQSYRIAEKRPHPYSDAASRARWARIEAAHEEVERAIAATDRQLEETSKAVKETDREVKELSREVKETARVSRESIQELSKEVKETARVSRESIQKLSRQVEETSREVEATTRQVEETSKEVKETTKAVKDLNKKVGGAGQVRGRITEEFFYTALRDELRIGALKFDEIYPNFEAKRDGRRTEYDLLLTNGELLAVVEVKHNLRLDDVEDMRKIRAPHARHYLRRFSDKKMLFVMAYMTADIQAVALAHECGYATLSPDGQKARADISCVRYVECEEQS